MRLLRLAPFALLALAGCGPAQPKSDAQHCTTQLECDKELRRVCEYDACGEQLPEAKLHNLYLSLSPAVRLRIDPGYGAFRAAVVYPLRPDGTNVTCKDIQSVAQVREPTKFNLTSSVIEQNLNGVGDVIIAGVFLNGPGRIVFVEVYDGRLNQGPDEEGHVIGVGCLEGAPNDEGAHVSLKIDPPA